MRLVLDTNTVVSGLLWDKAPSHLIRVGLDKRVELFTSQALILELEDVLPRRKFGRRVAASGFTIAELVARYALLAPVMVPAVIARVSADPDDDHVLACALGAQADLIVSGDRHLLDLKAYQGIPIVSAAEALRTIEQRAPRP